MQEISRAIVAGSLESIKTQLEEETRERIKILQEERQETSVGPGGYPLNRHERRTQAAIERRRK